MSRRPAELREEANFVTDDALLARALSQEARKVDDAAENVAIGAGYDELHKCSYTVDLDGTVSCKGCGKGSSSTKKASHEKSRKHAKPTKSY